MEQTEASSAAAPAAPPAAAKAAEPAWRTAAHGAGRLLGAAIATAVVSLLIAWLAPGLGGLAMMGIIVSVLICFVSCLRAVTSLAAMALAKEPVGVATPLLAIGVALMSGFGMLLAFVGTMGMSRGRQLRKGRKVLLPPLAPGGAWARLAVEGSVPAEARDAVAARWRENGRTEHASVAAFARLTMDLIALGAPPELIASANLDARDEIRHAELCFSLAKALDGRDAGPGPFPEARSARTLPSNRTFALAELAVDSLTDGALHEGLSARVIAQLARRCGVPGIRALLLELAADEGRHAAHGWDVVEWCLAEGGAPVAHALRGAVAVLPKRPASDLPPEARDGSWEAFGIHGTALEEELYARALSGVADRVKTLTEKVFVRRLAGAF